MQKPDGVAAALDGDEIVRGQGENSLAVRSEKNIHSLAQNLDAYGGVQADDNRAV